MSDPKVPPIDPVVDPSLEGGTGAGRWQVGLRTLFLATAAIAVWMAVFIQWQRVRSLAARIEATSPRWPVNDDCRPEPGRGRETRRTVV